MAEIKGYRKNIEVDTQISVFKKIISIHEILTSSKLKIAEKDVLSYYCVFKGDREADEMIIKDRVVGSMQVLYNTKSSLKKKKLLVTLAKKKLRVCDNLDIPVVNNSSFVMSKITAKTIVEYNVGDLKREILNLDFKNLDVDTEDADIYSLDEYILHHYFATDDVEIYRNELLLFKGQIKTENELRKICSKLMI